LIAIVARGMCSALGEGEAALGELRVGEAPSTAVGRDDELERAGLGKPFAARARIEVPAGADRASAILERAFASCALELDATVPGWRGLRIGAAIGTSSGGMRSFESFLDGIADDATAATYIGPLVRAARPTAFEPSSLVLGACASSTLAIGLARTWLFDDRCDLVLAGGFDAVSVFVAAGFESLRATCGPLGPRPFRAGRDGLALGEAAAIVALARPGTVKTARVHGWVAGFGATCDATHLTAPESEGAQLARAAFEAIADAGGLSIDLVSAHGTATRQNDAAEAKAIDAVLGPRAATVPVCSLKGAVGHTLGAAGALEVLHVARSLELGIAPASFGEGAVESGLSILDRGVPSSAKTALKLSSAFGGANAALVLTVAEPPARPLVRREVFVSRAHAVTKAESEPLALRTGYGADRIARADDLVRLVIAATAALEDDLGGRGALRGAGIIVGQGLATVETNAKFWTRIRANGPSRAEPRRFPYTSPNAAVGECAVAFGLTGPSFAVGGGPHGGIEAIGVASDLVRAGVAERIVVVAVDELGATTSRMGGGSASGAVALLVTAEGQSAKATARVTSWAVRLETSGAAAPRTLAAAHHALLPLTTGRPEQVTAEVPWGGFARATFFWL
jgi:3-oxoacyl-[acyl-carrier-protein] synthase II